ncbi:MAG: hypothetical protein A2017_09035 [Lentisphaerae bacterium GWF2_44_16]|nr:MAG: hypothetical protein A2017_09035 [Lentisphaerae bacterium GWF2_44_16]
MSAKRQKKYKSEIFRQELLKQIFSGELKVGDSLGPCRELSEKYNLSYVTVINVIKKLCEDGYLETRQGKGTTIKSANPSREIGKKSCRILIYEPVISNKTWSSFLKSNPDICDFYPKFVLHYKSLLEKENLDFHPDFIYTNDDLVKTMASRDILAPLDDETIKAAQIDLSLYEPEILEMLSYKGQLYALPFCFSNLALFYNKDIFDSAGIKYPAPDWKWKDLLDTAEKLTVREKNGRVKHYGFLSYFNTSSMKSFYVQGFPPEYDLEKVLKTKKYPDGLNIFLDILNIRHITPFIQNNEDFATDIFLNGTAAMIVCKYDMVKKLSAGKFRWGLTQMPAGRRKYSSCAVQGFGIVQNSKCTPENGIILQKICGNNMQMINLQNLGHIPAYTKLAKKTAFSNIFISQLPSSGNLFINYSENEEKINNLLYKMLIGLLLPEEIIGELKRMQSSILT